MSTSQSDMRCTVCRGQKHSLRARKSKLIPSVQLFLCDACFIGKKEPRWAIVLVARKDGHDAVAEWVKNQKYVGDPILLSDLIS